MEYYTATQQQQQQKSSEEKNLDTIFNKNINEAKAFKQQKKRASKKGAKIAIQ